MDSASSLEVASQSIENKIQGLYVCLDQMQKALRKLYAKRNKKQRSEITHETKVEQFKDTMRLLRLKLLKLLNGIFTELSYLSVYDQIAKDMMETLSKLHNEEEVDYSHYHLVIKSVMTSIIATIMDEWELSKASSERQQRRIYFAHRLINTKSTNIRFDTPTTSSYDEEGDICVDISGPPSQTNHAICTREKIIFLEILNEALTRHSIIITESKPDMSSHVYHVMNITHIVDILKKNLSNIKFDLLDNPEWKKSANISMLMKMANDFHDSLSNNLKLFDCEHPFLIYRNDLRCLLLQVKTIKRILNK